MTSVLFNDCTAFEKYLLKSSLSEDSIDIFTLNKKTIKDKIRHKIAIKKANSFQLKLISKDL